VSFLDSRTHPAPEGVDAGVTWTRNNSGLDGADVFGLTVSPQSTVFARTRSGVFRQLPG